MPSIISLIVEGILFLNKDPKAYSIDNLSLYSFAVIFLINISIYSLQLNSLYFALIILDLISLYVEFLTLFKKGCLP